MKKTFVLLFSYLLATANLLADPADYGRDYSIEEESSGAPLYFILLLSLGGWLGYSFFTRNCENDKDKDSKGCLGIIIGVIVVFAICYFINRL